MLVEFQRKLKALLFITLLVSGEVHQVQADIRLKSNAFTSSASSPGTVGMDVEAMMGEQGKVITEQMQSVLTNPTYQMESTRVTELMEGLVTHPNFQNQVKRTAELLEGMANNPKLEEQAKRVAERITAMMADANIQEPEKMQTMMANPNVQKQVTAVIEEIKVMFADPKLQEQAKQFGTEMEVMMANKALQERAKQIGEQMRSMMSNPILQEQAKIFPEHLEQMAKHATNEKLIDNVADKMFGQVLKSLPVHHDDLDMTTLGGVASIINQGGTWCGTATACFFLLSPMVQIFDLVKNRDAKSLTLVNPFTMISMLLNCSMWVWFGLFAHVFAPIPCNALGSIAAIFYLVVCWIMKSVIKEPVPSWGAKEGIMSVVALALSGGIGTGAAFSEPFANIVGYIATVFNLVLYASPLSVIGKVLKEKNSELLPPLQCWMQFFNTIFWCIVGVATVPLQGIIKAAPIMGANFPGLALAMTQLSLIAKYPAKKANVVPSTPLTTTAKKDENKKRR